MRFLILILSLVLVGCQSTSNKPNDSFSSDSQSTGDDPNQSQLPLDEQDPIHTLPTDIDLSPVIAPKNEPQLNRHQVDDVWQRISMQLSFVESHHEKVQKRIDWYLQHPNYMNVIQKRAEPFLYYIVTEVEKRGLPIELALMPLIESDFNTSAYSHKHASGLWQLTPLIATHYGVKIGPWYDGRQDIVDATNAALNFLTYLHKRFDGNWYHAIAAYNTGEGRVARAISKNKRQGKPTDFFSLKLPKQTRHYVPKLLAAAQLLKSEQMNFPKIDNSEVITIEPLNNALILDDAKAWRHLKTLNPGYTRFPALLDGPKHIVIKKQMREQWLAYASQLPNMPSQQWQRYRIKRGDSLSRIAKNHGITVRELKAFNQLKSNRIRAGDNLVLPVLADTKVDYKVKSGDSLWRIAGRFNVTVNKLKLWNNLTSDALRIGDTLTVFLSPP